MMKKINLIVRVSDSQIIRLGSRRRRSAEAKRVFSLQVFGIRLGKTDPSAVCRFLGIFAVICRCLQQNGMGEGGRAGGAEAPSSQGPRAKKENPGSNMNDRFGQVSGRVRREGGFESGAARRTPRRWRVGGYSGASWRDGLAGVAAPGPLDTGALQGRELPIRWHLEDYCTINGLPTEFAVVSTVSDILFRAKNAKENWGKDEGAAKKRQGQI